MTHPPPSKTTRGNVATLAKSLMALVTAYVNVPLCFVCGFLAAAEIAIAKTENGRVSTNWFKDMFERMNITWNQDYYMATRDKLHVMGVIQIIDRRCQCCS